MFTYLPAPYPDELLYSVIARVLAYLGSTSRSSFAHRLFGHLSLPSVDLPSCLERVANHTWPNWGMKGLEIACNLTLFPYYGRYVFADRATKSLESLLFDSAAGVNTQLGLVNSRVRHPRYLRYCERCRVEDIALFGETYWHRCHQLAGVLVCHRHGTSLLETQAKYRPTSVADYIDATTAISSRAQHAVEFPSEKDRQKSWLHARRCVEMLQGNIDNWPNLHISKIYRRAAIERGFVDGVVTVDTSRLEKEFVAFYSESALDTLGCNITKCGSDSWLTQIFRTHRQCYHPSLHGLVQVFLEQLPVTNPMPIGLGPWRCPNPYAKHQEDFPIRQLIVRRRQRRGEADDNIANAKCDCGFAFSFLHVDKNDPNLPVVHRRSKYGPTWAAEIKRLMETGKDIIAIAKTLNITKTVAVNIVNGKYEKVAPPPEQIMKWRREWLALLDSVPKRQQRIAKRANHDLYWKLKKHDFEWLSKTVQPKTFKGKGRTRVNWESRDIEWSLILKEAGQKLRESKTTARISPLSIIRASGLTASTHSYLDRLPTCRLVLQELSETLEEARERRLIAVARSLREQGELKSRSFLLNKAHLQHSHLTPRLHTAIENLLRKSD